MIITVTNLFTLTNTGQTTCIKGVFVPRYDAATLRERTPSPRAVQVDETVASTSAAGPTCARSANVRCAGMRSTNDRSPRAGHVSRAADSAQVTLPYVTPAAILWMWVILQ